MNARYCSAFIASSRVGNTTSDFPNCNKSNVRTKRSFKPDKTKRPRVSINPR